MAARKGSKNATTNATGAPETAGAADSRARAEPKRGRYVVAEVDWFEATGGPDHWHDAEYTVAEFDTEEEARAFAAEAGARPHEGADPSLPTGSSCETPRPVRSSTSDGGPSAGSRGASMRSWRLDSDLEA